MPEIQVRPVDAEDLPNIIALDHSYITDYVWQMDLQEKPNQISVTFREMRLPRSVHQEYPRDPGELVDQWEQRSILLIAELDRKPVGYVSLVNGVAPYTTQISDLVVMNRLRRKGIGTALLLAAEDWASHQGYDRIIFETQSKNYPAICLAKKLGFEYCGYSDRYYTNQDIALFFGKLTT